MQTSTQLVDNFLFFNVVQSSLLDEETEIMDIDHDYYSDCDETELEIY